MSERDVGRGGRGSGGRGSGLSRRTCLQALSSGITGGLAVSAVGTAGASDPSFDRVVDAVEDLGVDPTGGRAVDETVAGALARGDTKVVFPDGEYRWTGKRVVDSGDVGLVAAEGANPRIVVPRGMREKLLVCRGERLLFEGIDIDHTATNAATGISVDVGRGFRVADVTFDGRGHAGRRKVANCFNAHVADPDGVGVFENVEARKGSAWGHYKGVGGRTFCWVGPRNRGTLRFVDCAAEEFGNNAIYASASEGPIQVIGGEWWNNNVSSLRFHGKGCLIRGATIGVDLDRYSGPRTQEGGAFNTRAVRVESKKASVRNPGYLVIEDTDIVLDDVINSVGGIVFHSISGGAKIRDCRIESNTDGVPPIVAKRPRAVNGHTLVDGPYDVQVENCQVTGETGATGVVVRGRPDSYVADSCVDTRGQATAGTVETRSVSRSGCSSPDRAPGDGSDSGGGDAELPHTLRVSKAPDSLPDGTVRYDVAVTGRIAATDEVERGGTDTVDGSRASGRVGPTGGVDIYRFSGTVESFEMSGAAAVSVDGDRVDPGRVEGLPVSSESGGGLSGGSSEGRLSVGELVQFTYAVPDGVDSVTLSLDAAADHDLYVTVDGRPPTPVDADRVSHSPDGSERVTVSAADAGNELGIAVHAIEGGRYTLTVETDGQQDGGDRLPRTLRVGKSPDDVADGTAQYTVAVSDAIRASESVETGGTDSVSERRAEGRVGPTRGHDTYRFAGSIDSFDLDGPAAVYVDGERVDPDGLGDTPDGSDPGSDSPGDGGDAPDDDLPNELVIESSGDGVVVYQFTVSGDLGYDESASETTSMLGRLDRVSGSTGRGTVVGGRDVYRYAGELTSIDTAGEAVFRIDDNDD